MFVADESNQSTRVELQVGTHHYDNFWEEGQDTVAGLIRIKDGYTFEALKGILFYSHSYYKLMPRKDDDFVGLTDIKQEKNIPTQYNVSQNYPNPFNPSTKIQYTLPVEGNVILKIYNILGKEVKTLIANEYRTAGSHTVTFDAHDLPSGVYFYRLQAGNIISVKKMILLK